MHVRVSYTRQLSLSVASGRRDDFLRTADSVHLEIHAQLTHLSRINGHSIMVFNDELHAWSQISHEHSRYPVTTEQIYEANN